MPTNRRQRGVARRQHAEQSYTVAQLRHLLQGGRSFMRVSDAIDVHRAWPEVESIVMPWWTARWPDSLPFAAWVTRPGYVPHGDAVGYIGHVPATTPGSVAAFARWRGTPVAWPGGPADDELVELSRRLCT